MFRILNDVYVFNIVLSSSRVYCAFRVMFRIIFIFINLYYVLIVIRIFEHFVFKGFSFVTSCIVIKCRVVILFDFFFYLSYFHLSCYCHVCIFHIYLFYYIVFHFCGPKVRTHSQGPIQGPIARPKQ